MSPSQVILVTGANQGLGYAIIAVAAKREPHSTFILASRNLSNGEEAKKKLRADGIEATIEVLELDVTKDEQIAKAVEAVREKHGKLDVLINNAGILRLPADDSLTAMREAFDELCSVNLTSCAIVTYAFIPLLHASPSPKVINITSGLGSIQNALTKKMGRFPAYGGAKIGMNGASMHMQTAENDRIAEEEAKGESSGKSYIRYYIVTPGVLKTNFTGFSNRGKDPAEGAEAAVRLALDHSAEFAHATNWEFEGGEMRVVPW